MISVEAVGSVVRVEVAGCKVDLTIGIDAGSGGMSPALSLGHRSAGGPSVEEDASRGSARVPGGCS